MKIELKIIDFLIGNADKNFTINEIAKNLNEFYSFVHRIINRLTEEGVIIKNKIGKSYICSLNLENEKTLALLNLAEIEKRDEFYNKNKELKLILEDFVKSIRLLDKNAIVVLFGSYAKNAAIKKSDIDILIISKKINVEKLVRESYAKYGREINPIIMSKDNFKKQRESNIIKEITKNHYVLCNSEEFVRCVIKNEC